MRYGSSKEDDGRENNKRKSSQHRHVRTNDGAYFNDGSCTWVFGGVRGWLVVHLGEEALDFVGAAATSPEVEVEPHLVPETNSVFHQWLHSIKLATLQRLYTDVIQLAGAAGSSIHHEKYSN
jgi:hypothetical protein